MGKKHNDFFVRAFITFMSIRARKYNYLLCQN